MQDHFAMKHAITLYSNKARASSLQLQTYEWTQHQGICAGLSASFLLGLLLR